MTAPTILVVDEDAAVHQIFAATLNGRGCRVESAYSLCEGMERLRADDFELVAAGMDLLHPIRQLHPETKVVVLTDEPAAEEIITAMREQAFSYFSKPLLPNALVETVHLAMRSPQWHNDFLVLSARPDWITLRLRCKLEAADRVLQFLRELEVGLAPERRDALATAFRELLINAIEHGGRSDPDQWVRVSVVRTRYEVLYHIEDPGEGFSFDSLPHAAISNPPDEPVKHAEVRAERGVRPGGFGILLSRNLVDELIYNEKGNAVLLVKYLNDRRGC